MKRDIINAGLAVAGGWLLYRLFFKAPEQINFDRNLDEIKSRPLPLPPGQTRPPVATITKAEAQAIAERQYISMNRPGTDENELFRSLNGLNGADLRLVYEAFGVRNYYAFRKKFTLFQWYVEELERSELDRMRVYWYKSGLKF